MIKTKSLDLFAGIPVSTSAARVPTPAVAWSPSTVATPP